MRRGGRRVGEERSEREADGGRWLRMIEIAFNAGGVFCMATVGQGG